MSKCSAAPRHLADAFGWSDIPEAQHWKAARAGATMRLSEHAARLNS